MTVHKQFNLAILKKPMNYSSTKNSKKIEKKLSKKNQQKIMKNPKKTINEKKITENKELKFF